jgi:MFS family permease
MANVIQPFAKLRRGPLGERPVRLLFLGRTTSFIGSAFANVALLLLGHAQIWQLMVLRAVNGLSSAFFFPAAVGIVPQTVPRSMLQSAKRSSKAPRTCSVQ